MMASFLGNLSLLMASLIMIERRERKPKILLAVIRFVAYLFFRLIDGKTSFYMPLFRNYLSSLGVRISGQPLYICADVKLDSSDFSLIQIESDVVISSEVRILNHDYAVTKALLASGIHTGAEVRRLAPVTLRRNCFIGMRVLIMPGVEVGENSIIGAGSVVTKSIPENMVAAGNPAQPICSILDYSNSTLKRVKESSREYFHN